MYVLIIFFFPTLFHIVRKALNRLATRPKKGIVKAGKSALRFTGNQFLFPMKQL